MTRLLEILMVTHYFDSHQGGIEAVAGKLARGLAARGINLTWAAAGSSDLLPGAIQALPLRTWNFVESFTGVPLPIPQPSALRVLSRAVAHADVVLLHDCLYLGNIAAYRMAARRKIPIVIVQHVGIVPYSNFIPRALMQSGNRLFARPMLANADQVVFISHLTRRSFQDVLFKTPPLDIFNGVDTSTFWPSQMGENRAVLRARIGLPKDSKIALFVGRFVEKKGLNILKQVVASARDISFVFAGSGPLDPRAWNVPNAVVISGLTGSRLADFYRASDLLVLPSKGEGFPLVIQEALATGIRVICGADTAEADPALAPFVRGVPLDGNVALSAERVLAAIREELAKPSDDVLARVDLAKTRYSLDSTFDQYAAMLHRVRAAADARS